MSYHMLLIDKLSNHENFTSTEQRIADYILKNITDIPPMNIDKLSKVTYTSHSAVVRLTKKLGFEGFKDFKVAISEAVYSQTANMNSVDANFPFDSNDSVSTISKKVAELSVESIQRTFAQLDERLIEEAANTIAKSERIFLFAQGDSQIRARSFQNKLVKLNRFAILGEEYSDEDWTAANLTKKDCAIFISYGGRIPQYERMLTHFSENKIPSVVLTGNQKSPLIRLAQTAIVTTQNEYDFLKISTFSSQITFEYLLDTIFSVIYAKEYQQNIINLKNKFNLIQRGTLSEGLAKEHDSK